uniref:Zinc finger CCCH-type containing 15 n=1 Tax=Lepisosteus oculatus TaxID=7918 RepID=W5MIJ1_LEPOC
MPPKKPAQPAANKKTDQKKKEKIIEDKTFGLKNKKGAKQQKFIKAVTQQVKYGQQNARQVAAAEGEKNKKADKKKELSELNELFKPVVAAQKISKGKLCIVVLFYICEKWFGCRKINHKLKVLKRYIKWNIFLRIMYFLLLRFNTSHLWEKQDFNLIHQFTNMDALSKYYISQLVCKYFLDAIESNKYGWFWVCPGGGDGCMYRHALPPGFVLKKDKKKEEKEEEISLEELIENERSALGPNVTRITLETFLAWKKRKRQEKVDKAEMEMEKRRADFKAGKSLGVSGREVFEFRPELVDDDDEEADDTKYSKADGDDQEAEDTQEVNDIDLTRFIPKEVDNTGITVASTDRFTALSKPLKETDDNKLSEASGGGEENGEHSLSEGESQEEEETEAVPVDENLFTGEDLDELEEELNTLDLEE